ncbi:hypothetical protein RVR_8266 [Actinacidiphila reveromycinica]|uniref:Uncharacterized protein n=2 Tax=Actinacidiphila reveromycinica TaxID=659352 RepID=A0A7U3UY75_9ACTN|nr:hypothetical protein RVR_8266 [Streptomyces sp. SN-593]
MLVSMDAETELRAAAKRRAKSKEAFDRDDAEVRRLLVKWRAEGVGPSDMARWTGFTREWVAKIAPDPSRNATKKRVTRIIQKSATKAASAPTEIRVNGPSIGGAIEVKSTHRRD